MEIEERMRNDRERTVYVPNSLEFQSWGLVIKSKAHNINA